MDEKVEQLLDELERAMERKSEARDYVTSLTLALSDLKREVEELEYQAQLEVLAALGGYTPGEPSNSANDKVLGSNAETRARTLAAEMRRLGQEAPEGSAIAAYHAKLAQLRQVEEDLATWQSKLARSEDMVSSLKWRLRVYLADRLADTPISRDVLPF